MIFPIFPRKICERCWGTSQNFKYQERPHFTPLGVATDMMGMLRFGVFAYLPILSLTFRSKALNANKPENVVRPHCYHDSSDPGGKKRRDASGCGERSAKDVGGHHKTLNIKNVPILPIEFPKCIIYHSIRRFNDVSITDFIPINI